MKHLKKMKYSEDEDHRKAFSGSILAPSAVGCIVAAEHVGATFCRPFVGPNARWPPAGYVVGNSGCICPKMDLKKRIADRQCVTIHLPGYPEVLVTCEKEVLVDIFWGGGMSTVLRTRFGFCVH